MPLHPSHGSPPTISGAQKGRINPAPPARSFGPSPRELYRRLRREDRVAPAATRIESKRRGAKEAKHLTSHAHPARKQPIARNLLESLFLMLLARLWRISALASVHIMILSIDVLQNKYLDEKVTGVTPQRRRARSPWLTNASLRDASWWSRGILHIGAKDLSSRKGSRFKPVLDQRR